MSLADALELIQSDRARDRNEGLAEVKRIFKLYQSSPEINKIKDDSFHTLFEGLFRAVAREKANYSRSSKSRQQETTESRLAVCADALRSTVEVSLPRIRLKTLNALTGHFIQILPNNDRTLFEPLSVSYLKSLSIVLGYAPHVEHLSEQRWLELVDLCLESLEGIVDVDGDPAANARGSFNTGGFDSLHSRFSQAKNARQSSQSSKLAALLQCLKHLVDTSSHRLLERASGICDIVLICLGTSSFTANALDAFDVIRRCLETLSLESITRTQSCLPRVLSTITTRWHQKTPEIRDVMLNVLIILESHIIGMLDRDDVDHITSRLDDLLEELIDDYVNSENRLRRGHLSLEDLSLDIRLCAPPELVPMQASSIALRRSTMESDHNWMVLYFISLISRNLDVITTRTALDVEDNSSTTPRKRRKVASRAQESLRKAASSNEPIGVRIRCTQIIAFITNTQPLDLSTLEQSISDLHQLTTSPSSLLTCWALVALSGCATQQQSTVNDLRDSWTGVWNTAFRLISSVTHCRAASHILAVLLRQNLGKHSLLFESAEALMASGGLSHPALLCDSSLAMWAEFQSWLIANRPGGSAARCSQETVDWILGKWTPSSFGKRGYALQCDQILPVSQLICSLLPSSKERLQTHMSSLHPLGQACLKRHKNQALLDYLMVHGKTTSQLDKKHHPQMRSAASQIQEIPTRLDRRNAIIAKLSSELEKTVESLQTDTDALPKKTIPESVLLMLSLSLVAETVSNHPLTKATAHARLSGKNIELQHILWAHMSTSSNKNRMQDAATMILDVLATGDEKSSKLPCKLPLSAEFLRRACETFQQVLHQSNEVSVCEARDLDEMDVDIYTTNSQDSSISKPMLELRRNLEIETSPGNLLVRATSHIILEMAYSRIAEEHAEIPKLLADHLLTLSPNQLLSSSQVLAHLEQSGLCLSIPDAERLLEKFGEECMENYEYRRSEALIVAVLQALRMTIPLWTDTRNVSLADVGESIYDWLIKISDVVIRSSTAQIALSDFLFALFKFKSDYGAGSPRPSTRTSIIRVLTRGNLVVQYHLAYQLPDLFGVFVTGKHDIIFEDVHNSLPKDEEVQEGLALRVLMLSMLASKWSTLLRKCVYHIFETAALVDASAPYATYCMASIARSLSLSSPKEIFALQAPQIIYTWLQDHDIASIPYAIFGFTSLIDLLQHSEEEITSQMFMRGYSERITEMQTMLETSAHSQLQRNFSQTVAYCTAVDVSTTGPDAKSSHLNEARIVEILGKKTFLSLLEKCFPISIATILSRTEHDGAFEKVLRRHKGYEAAVKALQHMQGADESEEALPLGQQPSFKTRYLVDGIERLCRRTSNSPFKMWTPALTTIVVRKLLDDMHPALGQFHIRRGLRRIRIVVCLAGKAVLSGYPLEVLLHTLRRYLADPRCATDAIAVYRYLLENGTAYLTSLPSFVAGTAVSIYLGLRQLLQSAQDSTTQESQHLAMLTNVQTFHEWLTAWLDRYQPLEMSEAFTKNFHILIQAGQKSTGPGSSSKNHTHESKLLQRLLEDAQSPHKILTANFRDLCIKQLCEKFEQAESYRDDICHKDSLSVKLSPALWETSRRIDFNQEFKIWISKVLARSFRHEGQASARFIGDEGMQIDPNKGLSSSQGAIIGYFLDTLRSESYEETVMAERTLRAILGALKTLENNELGGLIPDRLTQALQDKTGERSQWSHETLAQVPPLEASFSPTVSKSVDEWFRDVDLALVREAKGDRVLQSIIPALEASHSQVHTRLFSYILHCTLEGGAGVGTMHERLSTSLTAMLDSQDGVKDAQKRSMIKAILYLWTQPYPGEKTRLDRKRWLNVDLQKVAEIAVGCKMLKTALYFVELYDTVRVSQSRRASSHAAKVSDQLLLSIFKDIDEPDAFHGVEQSPDLDSIADRLAFEGLGTQELLFRGAQSDSQMRVAGDEKHNVLNNVVNSLARLNMSSLTYDLGLGQPTAASDDSTAESVIRAAMRLKQWDVSLPGSGLSTTKTLHQAYQKIQQSSDREAIRINLDNSLLHTLKSMQDYQDAPNSTRSLLTNLVALNEVDELLSVGSEQEFSEAYARFEIRGGWTEAARLEDVSQILASRETLLSVIGENNALQKHLGTSRRAVQLYEVKMNLQSSETLRSLGSHQQSLNNVAYLSKIAPACQKIGLNVEYAVRSELSNVLWEKGELVPSIRILKEIVLSGDFESQSIPVGKAGLLATLGHRISEARLEKPDEILNKYLEPAQKALRRQAVGKEAGRVHHEFASYCHTQLQNEDSINEIKRLQQFVMKRTSEMQELESIAKSKGPEEQRVKAKNERSKTRKWLDMEKLELDRLNMSREKFLRQSLESYVLALAASDEHDTDVLRFVALWLEHATDTSANETVANGLRNVPLHKFAPLMNQLASRLQQEENLFQDTMAKLVEHICVEHPYHGMYHIYAGCTTKGGNDSSAISRNAAAKNVASQLQKNPKVSDTWVNVHKANGLYVGLAALRSDSLKSGFSYPLKNFRQSKQVEREIPELQVPPITLTIPLRPDRDYSSVPTVTGFRTQMAIASGLSAPKVLTATASDGTSLKQLFKGGGDDLRQDAIMEQVFEVVSSLLQTTRATRQRGLRIRTYKVVPLNAHAGAIEFVPHTMALLECVRSAHHKYNPKDMKWEAARQHITDGLGKGQEGRIRVYKEVTERFHPVLRHFFFENFEDPEEWYIRRLAYTRSTASISILGHALGLGDRHCQNILLDKVTGEAVHIDLGVAFEAGRVLQIPEVVPFRLTRDIVDGMGVMGVEGVFRRCCEFTLEALRNNRDAIMTLLNVLRYDPLYSWSMSPLRAKKMQNEQREKEMSEQQQQQQAEGKSTRRSTDNLAALARTKSKSEFEEDGRDGGEADRALSVVERKLAPSLSVSATVNELIQRATDERNLALLFAGWAAYA